MSLYNSDHPYSNGLEVCLDGHSGAWSVLFALVCERLQRIELELADSRREIDKLKAATVVAASSTSMHIVCVGHIETWNIQIMDAVPSRCFRSREIS